MSRRRTIQIAVLAALLAMLVVLPGVASAQGPPVTVNTAVDEDDGECEATPTGNCTLREALLYSQSGTLVIVPAREYVVTGELFIAQSLTIRGAGARTTTIRFQGLDGDTGRVLFVGSDTAVALSGVRITGGDDTDQPGGGIYVSFASTLHLTDSAIEDNTADRGGGIWSAGTLNLVRTTVARNHAVGGESQPVGGGIEIAAGSTATVEGSTVSRNTAVEENADGFLIGNGGGIYTAGNLGLHNVTIAENSAAGGAFGDGGGLFQNFGPDAGQTVSTNTLVARNAGGNCAGTQDDPIESTNGLSDELAQPSCNAQGLGNLLVADTRLGPLANNGGQTDTHALLSGSPGIDAGGAPCPAVDQRSISRPRGVRCDIGAYEFVPTLPSQPPPPPPEEQELPPPVVGKSVNALPARGTVKIKLPGTNRFIELDEGQQIPVGTVVDTRKGRVRLVAASNKSGGTSTALFYDGLFKLGQSKGSKPITTLTLVEKLACGGGKASAAAKKKKKRRLWGDGKGRFRTKGKHSAATVLGTKWMVEDRCDSTLTRVARGKVSVRDGRKTVIVRKGKKYVARPGD